jgi:hypothetical protein
MQGWLSDNITSTVYYPAAESLKWPIGPIVQYSIRILYQWLKSEQGNGEITVQIALIHPDFFSFAFSD